MINKILIANRGEIAVRIIRACKELGIVSVAVYSEADKEALHTQLADEAICIGPNSARDSYLNIPNILEATSLSGAEAIHPGFGFLSENSKFAKMCKDCNIIFIGPTPETMDMMGDKANARITMKNHGIPIVDGYEGFIRDERHALEIAKSVGFPVMIKAALGGGGKGIRIVEKEDDFKDAYLMAKAEALACFNNDVVYIEKYVRNPHHIEFQVLADNYGNVVHLFERDCSVQRKNQKIVEEAPSVFLNDDIRRKMGEVAVKICKVVNYVNAGTIEFLVDDDKNFYFMEMNTRIQVEHPITEMITGIDLIKEQIRIAAGERLSFNQNDLKINGHSIECRINAEDAKKNFVPCPGKIDQLNVPGGLGVRLDSAVYQGYTIPPFYDSMIAKLIVHGNTRDEAIMKMKRSLAEFIIDGITSNIDFHFDILNHEDFARGNYNTGFLNKLVNIK
ncbi:acetyl-CoA carboxylase, biotin carboxylase [Candidatus Arthromitus sp. SFB-mouse-Japan]|uniref:acetyl-CoA carboxylase biotin carboxylase subunit n=1 Tax=Candidatus Arthromitus sp. SFB-mouse TaxID=49118 RepID=UPI00021B7D48|nr:acetyl-CoA carboxylase biotin carboxylase subunit [Candidatus Arthromitus sp. SFB-mouse]EIA24191.1 acetyl-CoA carboxylase, biotin carboxylase [Candidatus Arthromitus sp. SFB-2]EIA24464.1 acetyl-CoA carboxylase, biotin carboxylase [Candidatus Arthromitus sp. SFB-1]EIA27746.1 acetyl-CoA carboxylase, biotin carboxylase [Candidatus Arthromitus sp. SFB-co]EIA28163.1 acetyl-CoA carboxylase, biotin carboxylase [Candidatus Arthromitus sp. SFB-5]EIA30179.1 Putative acetyl-CoA carboxylase, biotin car